MGFIKKYPLLLLFAAFIAITSVADMFISRRPFSEMENRVLSQRPKFTMASLLDKKEDQKYTYKYEQYINDQFVGRDTWITMKSVSESMLGKIENNGIVYGADKHLFEYYPSADKRRIAMNIQFINEFLEKYSCITNVTVGIIPNSYAVLSDNLPRGLRNLDQRSYISDTYNKISETADKLELFPVMEQAVAEAKLSNPNSFPGTEQQIYYRTDHHWTTLGAFSAYQAFVQSRGLKAVTLNLIAPYKQEVADFYGTYYSKCKLFSAIPDTITWYDIPFTAMEVGGEAKDTLHDNEKWSVRDKHAAFIWGNNDLTVIKSDNNLNREDGKTSRVLLIKDSYGNSFAPFLTYSYDEVYIVDLRFLTEKMSELMSRVEFDDVLILYNFMNFASDSNFLYLSR